jgi:hypothetical protein
MPTNKRITDLTDYTSVLPYASEMFGVYQPMIGWKSKRITKRLKLGLIDSQNSLLKAYTKNYTGSSDINFSKTDCFAEIKNIPIGQLSSMQLYKNNSSILLQSILNLLPKDKAPTGQDWEHFINQDLLRKILSTSVADFYNNSYKEQCVKIHSQNNSGNYTRNITQNGMAQAYFDIQKAENDLVNSTQRLINEESAMAGALVGMLNQKMLPQLETIFYTKPDSDLMLANQQIADMLNNNDDPFATFDPKKDIKNVSLSPLGIVHLFRQYFFELDTFLGTPTGHVWLSPGSTVELVEVSTRRVYTEKIIEQSTETTQKTENSTTTQDEISEAVKEDNKTDLKLGASLTVNQSWGTGNATATASLNMDKTQDTARETTHKRMREQTAKLSTEIKQNYKSTFKTITETTDTSSKRYVLNNNTPDLINYELRRKMRQVGVQVQDIGTYLCWETFVDEPGSQLGLANLVNIAKPADLVAVPVTTDIKYPPDVDVPFTTNLTWNFGDDRRYNGPDGFIPLNNSVPVPPAPDGYEVKVPNDFIGVGQISGSGEDFSGVWGFKGKLIGSSLMTIGPWTTPDGLEWDEVINFVVGGVVTFTPNATKRKAIDDANNAMIAAGKAATVENERKTKEAFLNAAKERIEFASNINIRKYEDLREEERIIVYRNLIGALMSDTLYKMPESTTNDQNRHVLSELINSIFDIDKMLYFVAPEWWKPRQHFHQHLGDSGNNYNIFTGNLTSWSDLEIRPDNYYITEKSQYAKMGSSLGWLLQLDGDDLRNAFLNAPWVKAVIPIRPGKELEATNWLQQMHIEGTNGLGDLYQAPEDELNTIRATLNIADVTIGDAIKYLCAKVAAKYEDSLKVGRYPKEEINDDNKVSATPIDKVYEHGFYPLKGGFRAVTSEGYEVFDQWIEVLPTDQVVPVEVAYNPKTGRQI